MDHKRLDGELKAGGRFERVLRSGRFAVKAELDPPESPDPEHSYRARPKWRTR